MRQRLRNLGYNLWYGWAVLIPFYNILVFLRLSFAPEGYADHKILDKTAKIFYGLFLGIFLLGILAALIIPALASARAN